MKQFQNFAIFILLAVSLLVTACGTGNTDTTTNDTVTITAPTTTPNLETITSDRTHLLPVDSKIPLTLTTATISATVSSYYIGSDNIITYKCPCGKITSIAAPYILTKNDGTIVARQGDLTNILPATTITGTRSAAKIPNKQ